MSVVMTFHWLFHGAIILLLLGSFVTCLANLRAFRRLPFATPPIDPPLVSILVPARNEERSIGDCVRALLAQTWPRIELIVLNDGSTDGTGDVLAGFDNSALRVIAGTELPPGWVGKNWACHQLAQAASGEFLFFTDADTLHRPESIASAMAALDAHRADFVSPWPRLVMGSWSELAVLPMLHLLGMATYPHWLALWLQKRPEIAARWPRKWLRRLGAANGQCILFRRDAYRRIGGHAAVPDHLVEDVALGREIAARLGEGMRFWNCDGSQWIDCRMYRSFAELWEGFTKNVRPAFEKSAFEFFSYGLLHTTMYLLPFFLLIFPSQRGFALIEIALIFLIRTVIAARFRSPPVSVLLHPVGDLLCILIGLNSWRRSTFSRVSWKGRSYRPAT
jgi:chlorobactene glucosyltransferase